MSSSWNSVNPLASWMDRPGKQAAKHVKGQRAEDHGKSKCRAVITRIGDKCSARKGAYFRVVWNGESVCGITSMRGKQV
jgi:hypothetical protein